MKAILLIKTVKLEELEDVVGQRASSSLIVHDPTASVSTMHPMPRPQRSKRYAPKVRTGCMTCKKRRVKCDETKPKCLKCLNSDYKCDGYSTPKAWIFDPKAPAWEQSVSTEKSRDYSATPEDKALVMNATPNAIFTPDESRSMQFYLRRTGKMVAKYGHSKFDFWTKTLPQAAHEFDSLKHILVAVALQDELLTSPNTIPKIERRIDYHYEQALTKTAYSKPTIENVLLNCLVMFYLECLRDNMGLIFVHLESARKIIDEWTAKDLKATPQVHNLIAVIDGIVTECRTYCTECPPPPLVVENSELAKHWQKPPASDPYEFAADAEHALMACISNLSRPAGQFPLALVRANAFLNQWALDSRATREDSKESPDHGMTMTALFHLAKHMIIVLNQSSAMPLDNRWQILLKNLQDMPNLRSARYRKPVAAVMKVLQQTSTTDEQNAAITGLQKHLQRAIVYDD